MGLIPRSAGRVLAQFPSSRLAAERVRAKENEWGENKGKRRK